MLWLVKMQGVGACDGFDTGLKREKWQRKKYRKAEANICPVNLTTNVQEVWVEHGEVGSEISVLKTREE